MEPGRGELKGAMDEQTRRLFDAVLESELSYLPKEVSGWLEVVPVVVDDEPEPALLRELGMGVDEDLCGLHWGVPLTERSVEGGGEGVDVIRLFRGPILRLACDEVAWAAEAGETLTFDDALVGQVHITLLHEIGHHFGLDEDDLDALGYA